MPMPDECYQYESYDSPWYDSVFNRSYFHNFGIPWCGWNYYESCAEDLLEDCCWEDYKTLNCISGFHKTCRQLCPPRQCPNICVEANLGDCICTTDPPTTTTKPTTTTHLTTTSNPPDSDASTSQIRYMYKHFFFNVSKIIFKYLIIIKLH